MPSFPFLSLLFILIPNRHASGKRGRPGSTGSRGVQGQVLNFEFKIQDLTLMLGSYSGCCC